MGLDMYLYKKVYIGLEYDHNIEKAKKTEIIINGKKYEHINLSSLLYNVGYWRKANAIHKWFVDNIQEGEDDCKEYYVDKNRLRELYEICVEISLLYENNKASIVKDRLTKLLPTQKGFLYGDTSYDESYFQYIRDTINILLPILEDDKNGEYYYYRSSW
jgi:hypothetical protein